MALPHTIHTVADLYAMPESERGERYELIEGVFLVTPASTWRHQTVSSKLVSLLDVHVRSQRLGWVRDNLGVYGDERTYVVPDAVFISRARRANIRADGVEGASDLIVEILSPSTRRQDLLTKRALYARIGVREYWLIDPEGRAVTVLALDSGAYAEASPSEAGTIASRVLPDLHLPLAELFEDMDLAPNDPAAELPPARHAVLA